MRRLAITAEVNSPGQGLCQGHMLRVGVHNVAAISLSMVLLGSAAWLEVNSWDHLGATAAAVACCYRQIGSGGGRQESGTSCRRGAAANDLKSVSLRLLRRLRFRRNRFCCRRFSALIKHRVG